MLLGAAVVLIGVAAGAYLAGKKAGHVAPPSFQQLTFRRGQIGSARFAPDGQTILYSAGWDGRPIEIFLTRSRAPSRARSVSPAPRCSRSPIRRDGGLAQPPRFDPVYAERHARPDRMTGGGAPREILEDVQWADWSPDGQSLAVVRDLGGKVRLEYPIGKVLYETAGWISHPRVSPEGDVVAFLDHPFRETTGARWRRRPLGKEGDVSKFFATRRGSAGRRTARKSGSPPRRRIQPRAPRRDAVRRRACAGPGDRGLIVEDSRRTAGC